MCPGVMRLTDPRFLGDRRHKDFSYFLKTRLRDLSIDQDVDTMVELCFSKQQLPGAGQHVSGDLKILRRAKIQN